MIKEAIILAGGLGTRLREAVPDVPKCMAPVNGTPFLKYVIDHFHNKGVDKYILALGYKSEIIEEYIATSMSHIRYKVSLEQEPLGTGGAVKLACSKASDKSVLIINGDTLFKIDPLKLSGFHELSGANCTLSLKCMHHFSRYGVVELDEDLSIKSFQEKRQYESGLVNGGVYALHVEKFLSEDLPDQFSFEKDYLEQLSSERRMFGVEQDEYFIDIGVPEDYERAQQELK